MIGAIRDAVAERGCDSAAEVRKCTKAGTGCGSCLKVLGQLVTAELAAGGVETARLLLSVQRRLPRAFGGEGGLELPGPAPAPPAPERSRRRTPRAASRSHAPG